MDSEKTPLHMKLVRRTTEQKAAAEQRRLAPMMRALKAIHSATSPESMAPDDLERQRSAQ